MKKTALALMLFASLIFSLNVSASLKTGEIAFVIDGSHNEKTNLTIFLWKDGVQVRGVQKNNVLLPYNFYAPYDESGTYELKVVNEKNQYASTSINATVQTSGGEEQKKEEQQGLELAIIAGLAGLAVLVFLLASFIKGKSYNK